MVAAGAEVAAAGSEEAGVAAASAEEVAEASTGAAGDSEDGAEAEGDKFCCCLSDVIFFQRKTILINMERRPGKKKLSKNLLEMKFMKRTKEKTEKIEEEEVRSRMFDGEVSGAMRDGASRIVVEPSYVNIENLRFGRLAFKGA